MIKGQFDPVTVSPESGSFFMAIGQSKLWFQRSKRDWAIHVHSHADYDFAQCVRASEWQDQPHPDAKSTRFVFSDAPPSLVLQPVVADRSFVVLPEQSLVVPSGEQVELFIGTPLWIQIKASESGECLLEIPSSRPADTWFGGDTQTGELCYAAITKARIDIDEFDPRDNRVITRMSIKNTAAKKLNIDAIKMPAPFLELYRDSQSRYWTRSITVTNYDNDPTEINLGRDTPEDHHLVTPARQTFSKSLITKTFDALIDRPAEFWR